MDAAARRRAKVLGQSKERMARLNVYDDESSDDDFAESERTEQQTMAAIESLVKTTAASVPVGVPPIAMDKVQPIPVPVLSGPVPAGLTKVTSKKFQTNRCIAKKRVNAFDSLMRRTDLSLGFFMLTVVLQTMLVNLNIGVRMPYHRYLGFAFIAPAHMQFFVIELLAFFCRLFSFVWCLFGTDVDDCWTNVPAVLIHGIKGRTVAFLWANIVAYQLTAPIVMALHSAF